MQGFCLVLAFVATHAIALAGPPRKYEVITANGKVTGHLAPNVRDTVEYLGIPYAQPPVGDLRFAAPVAPQGKRDFIAADWV